MTTESKIKLQIKEVAEPKAVGTKGAQKLTFKATAPDGKDYSYQTFTTKLFEYIKTGAAIEADVDTSSHEYDGNTYTDRKVMQIYVNGQPVAEARQGGGKSYNKSSLTPEQWAEKDRIERASIEAQVAFKGIVELIKEGNAWKVAGFEDLVHKAFTWANEKLGSIPQPANPPMKKVEPAQEPIKSKSDTDKDFDNLQSAGTSAKPAKPLTLGNVLTWCSGHGKEFNREWFYKNQTLREDQLINNPANLERAISMIITKKPDWKWE